MNVSPNVIPPWLRPKIEPSRHLFIKEVPRENVYPRSKFEELFSAQPGFVAVRYSGFHGYVEFQDQNTAAQAMERLNGYRYYEGMAPIKITYDRSGGQIVDPYRESSSAPYAYQPPPQQQVLPTQLSTQQTQTQSQVQTQQAGAQSSQSYSQYGYYMPDQYYSQQAVPYAHPYYGIPPYMPVTGSSRRRSRRSRSSSSSRSSSRSSSSSRSRSRSKDRKKKSKKKDKKSKKKSSEKKETEKKSEEQVEVVEIKEIDNQEVLPEQQQLGQEAQENLDNDAENEKEGRSKKRRKPNESEEENPAKRSKILATQKIGAASFIPPPPMSGAGGAQAAWYEIYDLQSASINFTQNPPPDTALSATSFSIAGSTIEPSTGLLAMGGYVDPYKWLESFLPFWERSRNIPYDPYRTYRDNPNTGKASSTLYVRALPPDITKRELELLFRFLPNFVRVRLLVRSDPIAFVDFQDVPSAHAAMIVMQGFFIGDRSLHLQYDRDQLQ